MELSIGRGMGGSMEFIPRWVKRQKACSGCEEMPDCSVLVAQVLCEEG